MMIFVSMLDCSFDDSWLCTISQAVVFVLVKLMKPLNGNFLMEKKTFHKMSCQENVDSF